MPTGQRVALLLITTGTAHLLFTHSLSAAAANSTQGLLLRGREPVCVAGDETIMVMRKDGCELHQRFLKSTRSVFTQRLMTDSDAYSVVGLRSAVNSGRHRHHVYTGC